FYEFPLRSLDDRLQIPCDPSRGKLDDAATIIFKICKYVDNSLILKLINHIKRWKSTNVKQPPQYNAENSQHSKNNIVNQEVKKKGSLIKPARDDHCDKQAIRSNVGITALDNDVNNGSQTHNKNHVNDNITDWINENKEKWTNNDKEKWTNNDKEKWKNEDKEKRTNDDKEKRTNDDKEKWTNDDKE
ncbi:14629_t:CDS:2, partial [Dentiscutata heterogama]